MHKRMLEFVKSSKKSDSKKRNKNKNRNASSKQGQNSCLNSDEDTTASETKVSEVNEANNEETMLPPSTSSSASKAASASTASFDIRGKEYYLSQIQVLENAIREMKHKTKQPTYFETGSC